MKKNILSFLIVGVLLFGNIGITQAAILSWNWDSGTTEGWGDGSGGTVVTVEPGRNGTFGLGAQQPTPYVGALFPIVKIEGQTIEPDTLVGGIHGVYLDMTGEIYIDVDRAMNNGHGDYVDLWIFGDNSYARFLTYPYDNIGNKIEELGDGWYRHYLANRFNYEYSEFEDFSSLVGTISLHWNWNYNATSSPVVFDNFNIAPVPVPSAILLFVSGLIGMVGLKKTKIID